MMDGYIKLYKKIFKSPIFKNEIMSDREAFIWMLCKAAYTTIRGRYGNFIITLQRGQLVGGSDYLGDIFQWNPSRVRRFLKRLQKDDLIDTQTDEGITVINIVNYDKYQYTVPQSDEVVTIDRLGTDDKVNNNNKQISNNIYSSEFEYVWSMVKCKKGSKKKAFSAYKQAIKKGVTGTEIISKYNALLSTRTDPTFWPHLSSWLNGERWGEAVEFGEKQLRQIHSIGKEYAYYGFVDGVHKFGQKDGIMFYKRNFNEEGVEID